MRGSNHICSAAAAGVAAARRWPQKVTKETTCAPCLPVNTAPAQQGCGAGDRLCSHRFSDISPVQRRLEAGDAVGDQVLRSFVLAKWYVWYLPASQSWTSRRYLLAIPG